MKLATVLSTFFFVSAVLGQKQLPSFEWQPDTQGQIPLLKINFPNGVVDFARLRTASDIIPVGPEERDDDVDRCMYDGYLVTESDVYVTLTGCANSDNYEVQFRSKHLRDFMFKVTDGQVQRVVPIFGQKVFNRDGSFETFTDGAVHRNLTSRVTHGTPQARGLNPRGYILRIKVSYDDAFFSRFGYDAPNAVRRVMLHAQSYWKLRDSLGTQVLFSISNNIGRLQGRYVAKTDLDFVAANSWDPNFDDFVYLTFRNNQPGTVGMGYVGTVCASEIQARSNLCEYLNDDMTSGHVVAHEIGHNMGMNHDFLPDNQPRYDSWGRICTNTGSVMDYNQQAYVRWSTCSVEDFTNYVNYNQPFCLRSL